MGKTIAWLAMTLLVLAVAGYAGAMVLAPALRPPFVRVLFAEVPALAYAHLGGGAIALAVGAFQTSARLRTRFLALHRWLGRAYVIAVLVGGVAAFAMALRAFGGIVSHLGFGLLAVCWVGSTLNAYRHIRDGNRDAHRRWMMRSYALTLAAVTLRLYLPAGLMAGLPFATIYPVIAWMCWVPNLVLAEWLLRPRARAVAVVS